VPGLVEDILGKALDYGLAGVALYLLYLIAFHKLSELRHEIAELKYEVRELRREVREWLSKTQGRS